MSDSIAESEKEPRLLEDYPEELSSIEHSPGTAENALISGVNWVPLLQRLGINLLIPFFNGIMLGFGEIFAHELGTLLGWRTARGFDPSAMPVATDPKARRRWLFGLW